MPIMEPRHDFMHPVEGDSAWSESYYFNAYDPVSEVGFFSRCGVRPNQGTLDIGMSVWLPGMEIAQTHKVREQHEMIDTGLEVDGLRYERLEPMTRWRLTCDAEAFVRDLGSGAVRTTGVKLDATFEALIPAIGADGQGAQGSGASAQTRTAVGKGHLEQSGRWTGWIEADGTRFELTDARGNRDKSWGPRKWGGGGSRMWRWFSINFGDDIHFGGIRIGTDAGDLHRGWVWKDGEHASIREWQVTSTLADDGVTHRTSHVLATDKLGRTHDLFADVLRVAPHVNRFPDGSSSSVNEGLARWTYEGREGWGISEYMHTFHPDGSVVIPVE